MPEHEFSLPPNIYQTIRALEKESPVEMKQTLTQNKKELPSLFKAIYSSSSIVQTTLKEKEIKPLSADEKKMKQIFQAMEEVMNSDSSSLMEIAIRDGNAEMAEFLIKQKLVDINAPIANKETFLNLASRLDQTQIANFLLENQANVNLQNEFGETPLHCALNTPYLSASNVELIKTMLPKLADIDTTDNKGRTPLFIAAEKGHTQIVEALLNAGANPIIQVGNTSPVLEACKKGHENIVYTFLNHMTAVDQQLTSDGKTALHLAASSGNVETVQLLLDRFPHLAQSLDIEGRTPIFDACKGGNLNIINSLMENGADLFQRDNNNILPLTEAMEANHATLLETLYSDERLSLIDNLEYSEAEQLAAVMASAGYNNVLTDLLDRGIDINGKNKNGDSLLHLAIWNGKYNTVNTLLNYTPPLNMQENFTPLDVNAQNSSGQTPLINAVISGNDLIIEKLSKKDISVEISDSSGLNALHYFFATNELSVRTLNEFVTPEQVVNTLVTMPIIDSFTEELRESLLNEPNKIFDKLEDSAVRLAVLNSCGVLLWEKIKNELQAPLTDEAARLSTETFELYIMEDLLEKLAEASPRIQNLNFARMQGSTTIAASSFEKTANSKAKWEEGDKMVRTWVAEKRPLTKEMLCELNKTIDGPGTLRSEGEEVAAGGSSFKPYITSYLVEKETGVFLEWLSSEIEAYESGNKNPIEIAARAYQWLVSIHPFMDGNGRTTRFIMDYILERTSLPPSCLGDNINVALFPFFNNDESPSSAVIKVTNGVIRSSQLLNSYSEV